MTTEPAKASKPEPTVPVPKRYTVQFSVLYVVLGSVLAAAIAGAVLILANTSFGSGTSSWSNWQPQHGSTAAMTREIATHVAQEYSLDKAGAQLVAVVATPPQVTNGTHKILISNIAVRRKAANDKGIETFPSGKTWLDQLCGLGSNCSIASGVPSATRGRLVRREALEVALYTFKFVPAIDSILAFMPPPAGETGTTLLYLKKDNLTQQLAHPLRVTLPLAKPPLPTVQDTKEAATIDKLTGPAVYNYSVQLLQDSSVLLVLDPAGP